MVIVIFFETSLCNCISSTNPRQIPMSLSLATTHVPQCICIFSEIPNKTRITYLILIFSKKCVFCNIILCNHQHQQQPLKVKKTECTPTHFPDQMDTKDSVPSIQMYFIQLQPIEHFGDHLFNPNLHSHT